MAYNNVLQCGEYVTIGDSFESDCRAFKTVSDYSVLIRGVYAPQCYDTNRPRWCLVHWDQC